MAAMTAATLRRRAGGRRGSCAPSLGIKRKAITLAAVSRILAGCATKVSPPSLLLSGETLLIQGSITESTAVEFKRVISQNRVSRVLLASGGGLVEPALNIATEIRERHLDVEVIGNCFSSCANYIFPAGATKTISGLGVVAWHGNMSHLLHMHSTGRKLLNANELSEVQRLAKLENEFFTRIGLDQFICWFGKLEPYNVRNLYFLDTHDMARFGLTEVKARHGYDRTDVSSFNANGVSNLKYVKVDWATLQRPVPAP